MKLFISIFSNKIKSIDYKSILIFNFLFCSLLYIFFKFDFYNNLFANDFYNRYQPNGLDIVNHLWNFEISKIKYFDYFFVTNLLTGLFLKLSPNILIFSIISNFFNLFVLFLSFYFFLKNLSIVDKNLVTFVFICFFAIYIGNWVWCFWKLGDIYFVFIFSLVFYFLFKGVNHCDYKYLLYAFICTLISLIVKPQGIIVLPFFVTSIFLLIFYKKNFFKILLILFLIYIIIMPLILFFLIKTNFVKFDFGGTPLIAYTARGNISSILFYKYQTFLDDFNLSKNNMSELFYYYFLIIKKIIYQITFLRETYSLKHNIFLIPYSLVIYLSLSINFDYLIKKYNIFTKLTIIVNFFSLLFFGLFIDADEPNRYQLFHLIPLYILVSISLVRFIKIIFLKKSNKTI
tara:strand:- start:4374 stop:5579 length:1206 start_codon:yes stop_codon:yes gene_type:complete